MPQAFERLTSFKNIGHQSLYFASDFHLGAPDLETSRQREKRIAGWLDEIRHDAAGIFLVGDIFDFWFEYRKVIPKGFIRFQSKLLELRDHDIPIIFFTGNHDKWYNTYFKDELGIPVYHKPVVLEVGDKRLLVGHGDGLGPGDNFYKVLKIIFEARLPRWLFSWLHPDIGVSLAHRWSRSSRISSNGKDGGFISKEKEWLWRWATELEKTSHHDLYIFGHRHLPLELEVTPDSYYFNLGEWVTHYTYLRYHGDQAELLTFDS